MADGPFSLVFFVAPFALASRPSGHLGSEIKRGVLYSAFASSICFPQQQIGFSCPPPVPEFLITSISQQQSILGQRYRSPFISAIAALLCWDWSPLFRQLFIRARPAGLSSETSRAWPKNNVDNDAQEGYRET
jgi:hypothetical protein